MYCVVYQGVCASADIYRARVVVSVMGPAGAGKSTFINTATNANTMPVEHSLGAHSQYINSIECTYPGDEEGRCIVFVDTPSIYDTSTAANAETQIHKWLARTYPRRTHVDGILFLYKISATRATESMSPSTYTRTFEALLGHDYMKKLMLVTTMWNPNEMEDCLRRESKMKWGFHMERFDQTIESAWRVVDIMLGRHPKLYSAMSRSPDIGDVTEEHIIIAVMGQHGAGKSSFINTVTSSNFMNVSNGLNSGTKELGIVKFRCDQSDLDFIFIDTPGCDSVEEVRQVLDKISLWLKTCYKRNVKPTGVLWLHRIVDNWFNPEQIPIYFKRACAEKAIHNLAFVTTMWDEYSSSMHPTDQWEKDILSRHWKPLIDKGCRTYRYTGSEDSAWDIIDAFCVRGGEKYDRELQREMVRLRKMLCQGEDNGGCVDSAKGTELFAKLWVFVNKERGTMRHIRALIRHGAKDSDLLALRYSQMVLRRQVHNTVEEAKLLGVSIGQHVGRISSSYSHPEGRATLILPGEEVKSIYIS
ncbi:Translocase of chloroplast [Pleurotus pulmonarius]|nr:Translocase of chloroplast [Pleurotus pulmonarius]